MNHFIAFFHHLFDPHCQECRDQIIESKICGSCELLKQQLDLANQEKRELLNKLINPIVPESPVTSTEEYKPKFVPWTIRRQAIEAEDRKRAAIQREKEKELGKLENEVIGDAN